MSDYSVLGLVKIWGGKKPPENWEFCDGQKKEISKDESMFSIVGTNFGGDGRTYFNYPKLDPIGNARYIICVKGPYPSRP